MQIVSLFFFLDPIHKAIGTSHAGWRGTVKKIGVKTLKEMGKKYGTRPEECLVGIGPSIGPCCFEVDTPVKDIFEEAFINHTFISKRESGKYHIDLWTANVVQLMEAGVPAHHITVAELCTCCHPEMFFSHRRDKGRTGSLAAIIQLVNVPINS